MSDAVRVQGLNEFRKAVKQIDKELPKALRLAFNAAADELVADTQRRVRKRSGRAARSVRAKSTQTKARVSAGGNRAPYYPWLDFGGRVGRRNSVRRPYIGREGRYLYRSYFTMKRGGKIQDRLDDELRKVVRQSGLEVT